GVLPAVGKIDVAGVYRRELRDHASSLRIVSRVGATLSQFRVLCYQTSLEPGDLKGPYRMEYVTLGRTGLRVSVAGLGCGGFSRLGLGTGKTEAQAVALIRQALDLGVNLLDTAAVYGTEGIVGQAIKSVPRDSVVIATKAWIPRREGRSAAERAVTSLDNSLRQLGTDYVDIFQLHGVSPTAYDQALDVIAPALLKEREKGKLRFLA